MNFLERNASPLTCLLLFPLCFVLTLPPFINDYIVGHDMLYHLNWNELFQAQLFQGDLYPRWLFEMKGGRGSPVFYFYSPLPYYFSAGFSLFLPAALKNWLSLGIAYFFALQLSAIGVYLFLKSYSKTRYALLCTVFYVLYPYHVLVDLYIRFAFAEFFAIAWIPYLFIFTQKVAQGERRSVYWLAIFYALLVLSHIPTTLLVTPFLLLFGCLVAAKKTSCLASLKGVALGTALASFYLLPILELKPFVSIDRMMKGDLLFRNSFLMADYLLLEDRSALWTFLENLSLVSLVVILLAFFFSPRKDKRVFSLFAANLICLFMMYPVSSPIWEALPILQIVQLPWRFYIVLSFSLFFLVAYVFDDTRPLRTVSTFGRFLMITVLMATSVMTGYHCYGKISGDIGDEHRATIARSLKVKDGVREYLPPKIPEIYFEQTVHYELTPLEQLFSGTDDDININYEIHGDQINVEIDNREKQTIILSQFYFPTWAGHNVTDNKPLVLEPTKEGLLQFELEAGAYRLSFSHRKTKVEIAGMVMSILASLYIVLEIYLNRKRPQFGT